MKAYLDIKNKPGCKNNSCENCILAEIESCKKYPVYMLMDLTYFQLKTLHKALLKLYAGYYIKPQALPPVLAKQTKIKQDTVETLLNIISPYIH